MGLYILRANLFNPEFDVIFAQKHTPLLTTKQQQLNITLTERYQSDSDFDSKKKIELNYKQIKF